MRGYSAGAILGLLFSIPLLCFTAFVLGQQYPPSKPHPAWIYGQVTRGNTDDENVQVVCQSKTTSLPFANREHATVGDVFVTTCRAVPALLVKG